MAQDKITKNQEAFSQSIVFDDFRFNWESYQKVYRTGNMNINTIYVETCKLLQNHKVATRIEELKAGVAIKAQVTLEEILGMMSRRARLDIRQMFKEDGSFKAIHDLTEDQAMCLESFNVREIWSGGKDPEQIGELKMVKIASIEKLWEMFLKKFGAFITKIKVDDDDLSHLAGIIDSIKE